MDKNWYLFMAIMLVIAHYALFGCKPQQTMEKPPQQQEQRVIKIDLLPPPIFGQKIYVPKQWDMSDCVRELRNVWFVSLASEDLNDVDKLKELIRMLWSAEESGKTYEEIRKSIAREDGFGSKPMKEILAKGI